MGVLALVRHGQSEYNLSGQFTGWTDVDLTPKGEDEARAAAQKLVGQNFDKVYTSTLVRAEETTRIILEKINQPTLPVIVTAALNERDYGELEGKTHSQVIEEVGQKKFDLWHRSWDTRPPGGESLSDTFERVNAYFHQEIKPKLNSENILVVASGNTLRALVKDLEKISDQGITSLEIPTGTVLFYEYKDGVLVKKA
jgi:2,3-bisphosphoglycerate-dependent phosphoglycerate mutase